MTMNELRELLLKDYPGVNEFWDRDPQQLMVTLLDGVEHTALKLARDSQDHVVKHNATWLVRQIGKYREAIAESKWDDAERLLERVYSSHTDLLVEYLEELNEHRLRSAQRAIDGGR